MNLSRRIDVQLILQKITTPQYWPADRGVSGFVTGYPCSVWGHGLTTSPCIARFGKSILREEKMFPLLCKYILIDSNYMYIYIYIYINIYTHWGRVSSHGYGYPRFHAALLQQSSVHLYLDLQSQRQDINNLTQCVAGVKNIGTLNKQWNTHGLQAT